MQMWAAGWSRIGPVSGAEGRPFGTSWVHPSDTERLSDALEDCWKPSLVLEGIYRVFEALWKLLGPTWKLLEWKAFQVGCPWNVWQGAAPVARSALSSRLSPACSLFSDIGVPGQTSLRYPQMHSVRPQKTSVANGWRPKM